MRPSGSARSTFIRPEEAADIGLEFIAEGFEGDFFAEVGEGEVGEEVIAAELPGGFEGGVAESGGEDAGDGAGRSDLGFEIVEAVEFVGGGESAEVEHADPAGVEQFAVGLVGIDGASCDAGAEEAEFAAEGIPVDWASDFFCEPVLGVLGVAEDRVDAESGWVGIGIEGVFDEALEFGGVEVFLERAAGSEVAIGVGSGDAVVLLAADHGGDEEDAGGELPCVLEDVDAFRGGFDDIEDEAEVDERGWGDGVVGKEGGVPSGRGDAVGIEGGDIRSVAAAEVEYGIGRAEEMGGEGRADGFGQFRAGEGRAVAEDDGRSGCCGPLPFRGYAVE